MALSCWADAAHLGGLWAQSADSPLHGPGYYYSISKIVILLIVYFCWISSCTWVNRDAINHEIHSDGNLGIAHEQGDLLANGANSYSQVFKNTGAAGTTTTYNYRCHKHPNMIGSIVVTNP